MPDRIEIAVYIDPGHAEPRLRQFLLLLFSHPFPWGPYGPKDCKERRN